MLIYAKKSGTPEKLHLYGTLGNVPSDDDKQLLFLKPDGSTPNPAPKFPSTNNDYLYLDGKDGTIKWVKDGVDQGQLNVFIVTGEDEFEQRTAVIPQNFVVTSYYYFTVEGSQQVFPGDPIDVMLHQQFTDGRQNDDILGTTVYKDSEGNEVTVFPEFDTYPHDYTITVWFTPEGVGEEEQNLGDFTFEVLEPESNEEEPET